MHPLLEIGKPHYPYYVYIFKNLFCVSQHEVKKYTHKYFDNNKADYHKNKLLKSSCKSIIYSYKKNTLSYNHIFYMDGGANNNNDFCDSKEKLGKRSKNIDKTFDKIFNSVSEFSLEDSDDESGLMETPD